MKNWIGTRNLFTKHFISEKFVAHLFVDLYLTVNKWKFKFVYKGIAELFSLDIRVFGFGVCFILFSLDPCYFFDRMFDET